MNELTDLAFFMLHKERMQGDVGRPLVVGETHFNELALEWKALRNFIQSIVKKERDLKKNSSLLTVGAWCGSASLANPTRDVDFAVEHNINRLDIVVNDHAANRSRPRSGCAVSRRSKRFVIAHANTRSRFT